MPDAPIDVKVAAFKAAENCFADCLAWGGDQRDALASAIAEYVNQFRAAGYSIQLDPDALLEKGKQDVKGGIVR